MTNNVKRFFSLFLALSLVFGLVVPAAATETDDHSHEQTSKAAPVAETTEETTKAASDEIQFEVSLDNITVNVEDIEFNVNLKTPLVLTDPDAEIEIDREDPAIIGFESSLKNITVWDEEAQEPVPLTQDQIDQILSMYGDYLQYMQDHADVLGMQTPFFLDFNDDKDGLGALGEMLALANVSVDAVRAGYMSYEDLTGMILNFYYADQLGVQYYGNIVEAARDEALQAVKDSGAKTEAQKLLVLNDWLAHNCTFDMAYIMNNGKEEDELVMVAENPQEHEHYQDVLEVMTQVYTEILTNTFRQQIRDGLKENVKVQYYTEAIKNVIYQGALAQARQQVIEQIRSGEEWKAAYEKAYNELTGVHDHSATLTVEWEPKKGEKTEEGVQAYEVKITAACEVEEDCEEELTVGEEVTVTASTTATCTVAGKTTYTVEGVIVKDSEDNEVSIANPEALTKVVEEEPPLGHDFGEGGKCKREGCEEVKHTHKAVVTLEWSKPDNLKYEASLDSVVCADETCEETLNASVSTTSKTTRDATCTVDGEITYTAEVTVVDSENQPVADVKVENPEQLDVIKAPGHNYENGVCKVCQEKQPVHEHQLTVNVTWDDNNQPSATPTCANANCPGGLTASATAGEPKLVEEATCAKEGKVKYTATVTVTENGVELPATAYTVEGAEHIVTTEKKTHDFNTDGICSRCGAVSESHSHAVTVTLDWKGDQAEAYGECACKDTFTVQVSVTEVGTAYEAPTCGKEGSRTYEATIGDVTDSKGNVVAGTAVTPPSNTTNKVSIPATGQHDFNTDGKCSVCGAIDPKHEPRPVEEASSASATPEFFTFSQTAATVLEEGEGEQTEGELTEEEIEEKATAMADEAVHLDEQVEQIVTGGTDEADTDIEKEAQKAAEDYVKANKPAINQDPVAFVNGETVTVENEDGTTTDYKDETFLQETPVTDADGNYVVDDEDNLVMMTIADQFHAGWEQFWADAEKNGLAMDPSQPDVKTSIDDIVTAQMDQPLDDLGGMTPNEAIPVYAAQAAEGLTEGIINNWNGNHIGALGSGISVCLGYTKALNYLVQCMYPSVYGKFANSDMSDASNWKTREELYVTKEDGSLDIDTGYIVDCVRIKFNAPVSMFGSPEDSFTGDHYWNAVKVDGKWYYIDPCYVDIYTEVMNRDRVETDGHMNHMYFLFSDDSARELYDGYMEEIRSLYEGIATDTSYEDSWVSRIKSNTYFVDGYAYYAYDSSDLISLMQDANNNFESIDEDETLYKIVRHQLTNTDAGDDGDTNYEALVEFNHKDDPDNEDEASVARILNPETGAMENSDLLTELYARHETYAQIYPSIAINASFYNDKMYFNLANCILSYDIATGEVKIVKEYNTVSASRDKTIPFGGMAFTIDSNGTHTVENAPVAGMTIKDDGQMYVSVATRFGFISGKSDLCDPASDGYGYEYEESNYNPNYNSYMNQKLGDYEGDLEGTGFTKEDNDNDEFMWSANFVEKLSMSHLDGSSHSYESVSVPATCGVDAYTENRCTSCGASEDGSRVYEEGTDLDHHFVEFHETYYTKGDNGNFNTGDCCVCTICGFAVTDPKEDADDEDQQAYDAIKATAGHTYEPVDGVWAEDNASVTFSKVECSSVCPDRKTKLDCLLSDDFITLNLDEETTLEATAEDVEGGSCTEGFDTRYVAEGTAIANGKQIAVTATKYVEGEPIEGGCVIDSETWEFDGVNHWHECSVCGTKYDEAAHEFDESGLACTICEYVNEGVARISGDNRVKTALKIAETLKETLKKDTFDSIIIVNGANEKFPDPLTGSYLASVAKAPILMCNVSSVSQETLDFIQENLDSNGKIYLLGGVGSISKEVEAKIGELAKNVVRLAGDNRYATNLKILEEAEKLAGASAGEILIARGDNFADSLSASATGLPILVVDGNGKLRQDQKDYLLAHKTCTVTILGGVNSVSEDIREEIETLLDKDGEVDRVAGNTRGETSVAIAERYFPNAKFATITYSQGPADGLCGGVLANALNAPMLLTNASQAGVTNGYIAGHNILSGYILGGPNSVSDDTAREAFGLAEDAQIKTK